MPAVRTSLLAVAALAALLPAPAYAQPTKVWSFKAVKGFIDNPVAFDDKESRFAFVHTDSAQFLTIVVVKTDGFKQEREIKIEDSTLVPKRLFFVAGGAKLLFVWMDGQKGLHGAMLFNVATGKTLKRIGPATLAEIAEHKGEPCLTLTQQATDAKGNTSFTVSAHRAADLKPLGTSRVVVKADQLLQAPPLRLLYWEPGHLSLIGTMKGKYDRKRDVRLPERAVRWSVLARKELWGAEPQDVLKWTQATSMRPNHPGQLRLLQVSDNLKHLHFVDEANGLLPLTTPIKWGLYEPKSLVQSESWDGKTLWFSLTVDPVNPEAVRRKKADPERMDLYRLDPGPKTTLLGQVLTAKRGFSWSVGQVYLSYLRKLKGFSRGGNEIEVHRVKSP